MPDQRLTEFGRLKSNLISTNDSQEFHLTFLRLSQIAAELWPLEEAFPDEHILVFETKKFDFKINLSDEVIESVRVRFVECTFEQDIHLSRFRSLEAVRCTFKKAYLSRDQSNGEILLECTFTDLIVPASYESGWVDAYDCTIKRFVIKTTINSSRFVRCTFESRVHADILPRKIFFNDVDFVKCTFKCEPDFLGADFRKDVTFWDCKFKLMDDKAGIYYRDLKHKMSDNQDDFSASFFAGLELKCKHSQITSKREKILSNGYHVLSDYGLDPYRPGIYISVLFLISFLTFYINIHFYGLYAPKDVQAQLLGEFEQAIYIAIVTTIGPLRLFGSFDLLKISAVWPQLFICTFTAISSLLWFFLILAIRRRFKVG